MARVIPASGPAAPWAGKACSSRANRAWLRRHGIKAVIPVKEDQKAGRRKLGSAGGRPPVSGREYYKQRNTVTGPGWQVNIQLVCGWAAFADVA